MKSSNITAVILSLNEEIHIGRCIQSITGISDHIIVVDSGSSDRTVEIANSFGATVIHNPWHNYATQFNFALDHLPEDTKWILRIDADEVVSNNLRDEIIANLQDVSSEVSGVNVARRMSFLGRPIMWGGLFPIRVVRLFRANQGRCEDRWMDEHIIVDGETIDFEGEIMDDNLNSLTWWIEKHNGYASREVVDLLNLEYRFMNHQTVANLRGGQQAGVKRWIKENVYVRLPSGSRALAYFCYRYIIRLGFLDGRQGAAFHVLQGFWYRYLVDMKLYEVKKFMRTQNADVITAIREVLGITLNHDTVEHWKCQHSKK